MFAALKGILSPCSEQLICTHDSDQEYSLNTPHVMKNKKSLFFAAVKINKHYVSFHLMPVYVFPDLLTDVSSQLLQRMHGKSCFNFRSNEEIPLPELGALVESSMERFASAGYLKQG